MSVVFEGSCTAMITPFTADGIDYEAYGRLIDRQIEGGTDALLILGTTGEPPTITMSEKDEIIRFAIDRIDKRVPAIVSTGGNCTEEVIDRSRKAELAGADALLVVTPYYNKATPLGLVMHYMAVADSVNIPIIVYNVPGRTGLNMTPAVFAQIAQHKNIVGIKEAAGNTVQAIEMMRLTRGNAVLYSGDDPVTVPLMSMGAKGVISVASNIVPQDVHDMCTAALLGNYKKAAEMQYKLNPLVEALFCEVNPVPIKTAAGLLGLCDPGMRLPLSPMSESGKAKLIKAMQEYGLKL